MEIVTGEEVYIKREISQVYWHTLKSHYLESESKRIKSFKASVSYAVQYKPGIHETSCRPS